MGKQLMYGESSKPGWTGYHSLTDKNVDEEVTDSVNNKKNKSKLPKVSVPSPFARFELVQKAFGNVAAKGREADVRDSILVSHALDVAQLFFEFDSHQDIKVVKWNKHDAVEQLKNSRMRGNSLFGESLELYMRQENYGFDEKTYYSSTGVAPTDLTIYILTYAGDAVGCTSPTSLFMATPSFQNFQEHIRIEGDQRIFSGNRPLIRRDEAFIEYLYRLAEAIRHKPGYGEKDPLSEFKEYLSRQKELLRDINPDLYRRINQLHDYTDEDLNNDYRGSDLYVLGYRLYMRRKEDMQEQIPEVSDFVIVSSKSPKQPLVLTNNCPHNNWRYYSNNVIWSADKHKIDYKEKGRNCLPGTETEYPWLCENDFLSDVIVQLPYPLDPHFFNGNLSGDGKHSYLLPLRSLFFEYFDYGYLKDKNGSEWNFKIEEEKRNKEVSAVVVTLLVTVKGGRTLALKKTYKMPETVEEGLRYVSAISDSAIGCIVECPVAVSLFPFVRLKNNNYYTMQLARSGFGWDDFNVSAEVFHGNIGTDQQIEWETDVERSKHTRYYSVRALFDYLRVVIGDDYRRHEAILLPEWGEPKEGTAKFKFAFDFGTTNSHVAVMDVDTKNLMDFKLSTSIVTTLDLNRVSQPEFSGELVTALFRTLMKQEFLPDAIGETYSFPLRTVALVPKSIDFKVTTPQALRHINIPFIYGKEDYGMDRNKAKPNIKWSKNEEEQKFANAFVEELVLLARGFAVENGGDLSECSFVWTYPLSMKGSAVNDFNEQWIKYYQKYFSPNTLAEDLVGKVLKLTESIAPLLYYRDNDRALSQMGLSIDIGGGTCDVVIIRNDEDIKVNSFRFAADVIFGAGKAVENPMIQAHCDYFKNLLDGKGEDARKVREMLMKICEESETESTEANSVLFSLENHPLLGNIAVEDRSYNVRLKRDGKRKVIFIYFYAAVIYYLVKLLQDYGYTKPEKVLFSGTGSKLLNIIGGKETLEYLTTQFITKFSEDRFVYSDDISIEIERKEPKQLTAKGALHKKDSSKKIAKNFTNSRMVDNNTIRYSMIVENGEPKVLKYADLNNEADKVAIVAQVEDFNHSFMELCKSLDFAEEYGCDEESLKVMEKYMNRDLRAYLDTEISDNVKITGNEDKDFEDSLFFYPVKGVIHKLIRSI